MRNEATVPQTKETPIAEARRAFLEAQSTRVAFPPAEVHQQWIPGYKGEPISTVIVRPKNAGEALPTVMYFHGGGFVLGGFETHERLIRDLVAATNLGFVFVEYSRAPEAVFPRAIEEAYAATRYIAEHGAEFGLDGSRLVVAGDCAGANLATGVALLAKYRGGPRLRGQLLLTPMLDATRSLLSGHAGTGVSHFDAESSWRAYAPDPEQRSHALVSPALSFPSLLRGLPAACIITAERDPFRIEGEVFAQKLQESDVDVTAACYLGCSHDFLLRNSLAGSPAARGALALAADSIARLVAGAAPAPRTREDRAVPVGAGNR